MPGLGAGCYPILMDENLSDVPGPWRGMFACAFITAAGFLATASVARVFLP